MRELSSDRYELGVECLLSSICPHKRIKSQCNAKTVDAVPRIEQAGVDSGEPGSPVHQQLLCG